MTAHDLLEIFPVRCDHEADLHIGERVRRYCIDRLLGVAGAERQHLQVVPAEHTFSRCEAGFAVIGIDFRLTRIAAHGNAVQRTPHRLRHFRRPQAFNEDAPVGIDHRCNCARQHHAGIAQQAAPVARMMAALAQVHIELEVHDAARTEKDGRVRCAKTRAIGSDQDVGAQFVAQRLAYRMQTGRAHLLAGFIQQLQVEAEPPAACVEHSLQRGQVDAVLTFVISGAASIPVIAGNGDLPRRQTIAPLRVVTPHDVSVPIGQDRRHVIAFLTMSNQERPRARHGIVDQPERKTEFSKNGGYLVVEIRAQHWSAFRLLAFCAHRDAATKVFEKNAGIVQIGRSLDSRLACHFLSPMKHAGRRWVFWSGKSMTRS